MLSKHCMITKNKVHEVTWFKYARLSETLILVSMFYVMNIIYDVKYIMCFPFLVLTHMKS